MWSGPDSSAPSRAVHTPSAGQRAARQCDSETVKQAEDGNGVIVRLYEIENARTEACLTWNRPIASVEECNCIEEKQADAAFESARIPFVIKPYEIKTFRIREKE